MKTPPPLPSSASASDVSDENTPHSTVVADLAAAERFRYKNYASEEAISEALMKLMPSAGLDDATMALRGLWVRAVDWGAKWQENQQAVTRQRLEDACREIADLKRAIVALRERQRRAASQQPAVEEQASAAAGKSTLTWDPRKEPG